MKLSNIPISEEILDQLCIDIPYLYGIRLWLPKGSNPNDIAEYINEFSSYHAKARESGINHSGEELPTLSISVKTFGSEGIFQDIAPKEMAEILINSYQKAEQCVEHLRSARFWVPLSHNLCGNSEQIVDYINQNYSEYQAHTKDTVRTPQGVHLPTLVIGSSNIIK